MGGWHKGFVFVNGFNLGRYWCVGPQRTLYLPGELLKDTDNVIEVFEINRAKADLTVEGLDHSLLTEEVQSSLLSTDFRLL
jgi:beta-galactosidase